MFLQSLMGCLAGSAHMPPQTGWEPFSAAEETEDYSAAEWADIIRQARKLDVKVDFTSKGIKMSRGESEGLFRDYRGGVKMAQRFLDSL